MSQQNHLMILACVSLLAAPLLAGCAEQGGDGASGVKTACGGGASEAVLGSLAAPAAATAASLQQLVLESAARSLVQTGEPLKIGTLLPMTGSLAAFGPHMRQATELAVAQINAAGGVNGQPVELVHEDSRTDSTQAPNAFNSLVNAGVSAVVGAASSGVTGSILDLAVDNQIVVVTPASTSPALTMERSNDGFFYRVPPSDALQGDVLANLVYEDGCRSVGIIAVNNPYGVGLGNVFEQTFESLGGSVTQYVKFEEGGTTFTSQIQQAASSSPDALVFIGYPQEGGQVVKEAYQAGVLSRSVLFFSEGVKDPAFVQTVGKTADDAWILAGLKGTTPASAANEATQAFVQAFRDEHGEEPGLFAAESYDAVFAIALAAQYAGENTGPAIKGAIRTVYNKEGTGFHGGQATQAFAAALLKQDVNYVGASGDFDWDENGDPTSGVYSVWTVTEEGAIEVVEENIEP